MADHPTPEGLLDVDVDAGRVAIEVDASIYPLEAVYGAAYVFIDRSWVLLDRPRPDRVRITLRPKIATDEAGLVALVGELGNELLSCAWRGEITRNNRAVIEAVTMQAFAGAMGPPSLAELEAFDFTEEPFDDPLGIAQSWEEKYKKKKPGEREP